MQFKGAGGRSGKEKRQKVESWRRGKRVEALQHATATIAALLCVFLDGLSLSPYFIFITIIYTVSCSSILLSISSYISTFTFTVTELRLNLLVISVENRPAWAPESRDLV